MICSIHPGWLSCLIAYALMGAWGAGQVQAANIRYQASGDYFDTLAVSGTHGWQAGGGGPGGVPGAADTARFSWASNTVTLAGPAPTIAAFQMGVDESGGLVVNSGGVLTATGDSTVGNNAGGSGANLTTGFLTINSGGTVNNGGILKLGAGASTVLGNLKGIITINGGSLNLSNHLWVGSSDKTIGTINITNGGVLAIVTAGMIGLGGGNTTSASGGQGFVNVQDGGRLDLFNLHSTGSIWPGSKLDISGSGVVTIPGDKLSAVNGYIAAGRITAYGGTGTVAVDYNRTHPGKTTLTAVLGYVPPTQVVWNPAANPSSTGKWTEEPNWTGFAGPTNVTKVVFNVAGAIPCKVDSLAVARHVVMGDNGPGGTLIITDGGSLACVGDADWTAIGYNSNALMVVEGGATATFGYQLWVGFGVGAQGTLVMNGGTVTVSNMFGLGWGGGAGTAHINGGTLNLMQWSASQSISGSSVLDVSGAGTVVIHGDQTASASNYIGSGKITAHGGTGTVVVDYNNTNPGKTTLTANHIPVASDIETTVGLGGSVTIPIIGGKYAPSDLDAADIPNLTVTAVGGSPVRGSAGFDGTSVTYTSDSSSAGPDSFTYTVSDQRGGTVVNTINILVTAGGNGANIISLTGSTPAITVTFAGMPGSTYDIERAGSPSGPWTSQGRVSTGSNGLGSFTDDDAPSPTGYFRTRLVGTP